MVAASLLPVVRIWHSALQRFTNNCLFRNRVPWRCSVHGFLDARGFPPKAETAAGKLNSPHAEARARRLPLSSASQGHLYWADLDDETLQGTFGDFLTVDGGLPLAERCRLRNVTMEVQYYPTHITKSPVAAVT